MASVHIASLLRGEPLSCVSLLTHTEETRASQNHLRQIHTHLTSLDLNHNSLPIDGRDPIPPDAHNREQEAQPGQRAPDDLLLEESLHIRPHLLAIHVVHGGRFSLLGLHLVPVAALAVRIRPAAAKHLVAGLHPRPRGGSALLPLPLLVSLRSGNNMRTSLRASGTQGKQVGRNQVRGCELRGEDQSRGVEKVGVAQRARGEEVGEGKSGGGDGSQRGEVTGRRGGEGIEGLRGAGGGGVGQEGRDGEGGERVGQALRLLVLWCVDKRVA